MSGATRGVKKNKARKIETETNLPRSGTNRLNRATRGVKQNKARKIETVESSQQQAERVEQTKARKIETETSLQ